MSLLAATPPMGWNSWNTFGHEVDETVIRETADALVESGLRDAGYEYVVIDDLWEADERVNGRLTWDRHKFPSGIPDVAAYVHGRGLKLGIYSSAGTHTCAEKPASYGYEEIDARTFAEWGIDYLKYDNCHVPPGVESPRLFQRMGQALRMTGRSIIYSICEWGVNKPWEWGARAGGHLWRTTGDINDSWESIVEIGFNRQEGLHPYAGPGRWNDPDMLVVGMYGRGNVARGGCTDAEYRSHFALWSLLAAPLMIGCDVRQMTGVTHEILSNTAVLAVNQDPLGRQGYKVGSAIHNGEWAQVWAKPLADGSVAVGLFNMGQTDRRRIGVAWESLGLHDRRACQVRDLWRDEELGHFHGSFSAEVDTHDVMLVRIAPRA
jgi:alpha-galactosidase